MTNMDRRSLLWGFGVSAVTPIFALPALGEGGHGKVTVSKAGENRYAFASAAQAKASPCKLTNEESGGACTVFEINVPPKSGPFLHVHHREDEMYYVLAGEFVFRAGDDEFHFVSGESIWLPRGIKHVWANTGTSDGKMILMCQPGGFEKFFDEIGNVPMDQKNSGKMKELMAKYGMEMLGPPIYAPSWMQQKG